MEKYTLIVTEKPDAAKQIAFALDYEGKPERIVEHGVPYYKANRDKKILVVSSLGHLYTVSAFSKRNNELPILDYVWAPRYQVEKKAAKVRFWLQLISKLAKEADSFIDACDYDIEGSVIGYCILKFACGNKEKEARRMKFSTLTKEELEESYATLMPQLNFAQVESGLARHEIDWLYGINVSKSLTVAAKKYSNQYTVLSTGRVQGPTLKILVNREKRIKKFIPSPYWDIKAKIKIGKKVFVAEFEKKNFDSKEEADSIVSQCEEKNGEVDSIETKKIFQNPPPPFDLSSLQLEAFRLFGYTPLRTLGLAQQLYLNALISYPRTNSQKLPANIKFGEILKNLVKNPDFAEMKMYLVDLNRKPTEGKKQDSAHPAIYPTGKIPEKNLGPPERNIYNLVVRRFFSNFGKPAIRQSKKIELRINGSRFAITHSLKLDDGWRRFYEPDAKIKESAFPQINKGENVNVQGIILETKFTKQPPRYNSASLLRKMEQSEIGTKTTRAGIVQTLYKRKYIQKKNIVVTNLGLEVANILQKFCPIIISAKFTRQLEEKMKMVQNGEKTKAIIVSEAKEILKPVVANLKMNEHAVGEQLSQAVIRIKVEENTIGPCPRCNTGNLIIQHSKKTGKRFVGCTNYFNGTCNMSFPLPQKGNVKPSGDTCKKCGWFTVEFWPKNRQQKIICLNSSCSISESWKKQ